MEQTSGQQEGLVRVLHKLVEAEDSVVGLYKVVVVSSVTLGCRRTPGRQTNSEKKTHRGPRSGR